MQMTYREWMCNITLYYEAFKLKLEEVSLNEEGVRFKNSLGRDRDSNIIQRNIFSD